MEEICSNSCPKSLTYRTKSKFQRQLKSQYKDGQNGAVERLQIQKLGDKNFYPGVDTN